MIKVSVMYPNSPGVRFDHAYYRSSHMPLVKAQLGDACKYYTVDRGVRGFESGASPTYVGMCHVFCETAEAFQCAMEQNGATIMGDIQHFTDADPVIQISDVVVG